MSNIETIMTGVKTVVQAALGTSWKPLEHIIAIEKNKWKGCTTRWGVIPSGAEEVSGVVHANTLTHTIRICITDEYITCVEGDDAIVTKMIVLMGKLEDIFKALTLNKCGAPTIVRNVSGFAIDESMMFREPMKDRIIVVEGRFTVRSQTNF
jgi:hypothetical protein